MKRFFDLIVTFLILLLFWPLVLWTVWLVRRKLGSPVFFRQTRPGLKGKLFEMVKFRTMTDDRGPDSQLLPPVASVSNGAVLQRSFGGSSIRVPHFVIFLDRMAGFYMMNILLRATRLRRGQSSYALRDSGGTKK